MTTTRVLAAAAAIAFSTACHSAAPGPSASASQDANPALKDTLIALERQSWAAWKNHDAKFWQAFLSEDHIDVEAMGIMGKPGIVNSVASTGCKVDSYAVDNFRFMRLTSSVAVLTYRAEQASTCGKAKVPSPTMVTSVFVLRDGRWLNAVFQQSAQPAP